MKPKHQGGYTALHAELCERTLVTLLRGLGPWKAGFYLAGGLVPRYLIPRQREDAHAPPPHAGTTDVDLVLDLDIRIASKTRLSKARQGANGHPIAVPLNLWTCH